VEKRVLYFNIQQAHTLLWENKKANNSQYIWPHAGQSKECTKNKEFLITKLRLPMLVVLIPGC
jgi:hypothetical protein